MKDFKNYFDKITIRKVLANYFDNISTYETFPYEFQIICHFHIKDLL